MRTTPVILGKAVALLSLTGLSTLLAQSPSASIPTNPDQTIQMEPVEVIAPRPKIGIEQLKEMYEKLDHLVDGPFPELRSGFLIEDILWRHRYLVEHPADEAIILVGSQARGGRITTATTVYTKGGEVYASSIVLGENKRLRGFFAEDLRSPQGQKRIRHEITSEYFALSGGNPPSLGGLLMAAQETGNYSILGAAGGEAAVDPFNEKAGEVLDWSYRALHDRSQAGLIPVALNPVTIVTPDGKSESVKGLVFDWEGIHYFYHPDWGTYAKPLPLNPETGLPYLCVRNGAWMENINFCATYLKTHPREKAVVIPGESLGTAYTTQGRLCLFTFPFGKFKFPAKFGPESITDVPLLAKLRDLLVTQVKTQRSAQPDSSRQNLISDHMPGDDADMQLRRVFLAFQAAGIPVHLNRGASLSVDFIWQGINYKYASNQQVVVAKNDAP